MTQSFDEWWKTESLNTFDYPKEAAESGFEAGQQSRQTEIDKLEMEIKETQAFLNNQNHIKQTKIDELQKRVDRAMKYTSESPLKDVSRNAMINFLDILKGKQDD